MRVKKILSLAVVLAMVLTVMPAAFAAEVGSTVTVNGVKYKVTGTNIMTNGDFSEGLKGWSNAKDGEDLAEGVWTIADGVAMPTVMGASGTGNADSTSDKSVRRVVKVEKNKKYYVTFTLINSGEDVPDSKAGNNGTGMKGIFAAELADGKNGSGPWKESGLTVYGIDQYGGVSSWNSELNFMDGTTNKAGRYDGKFKAGENKVEYVVTIPETATNPVIVIALGAQIGKSNGSNPDYSNKISYKDFAIQEIDPTPLGPDASVTVNIVDKDGKVLAAGIAGTGVDYYAGDEFNGEGMSFNTYYVIDNGLYTVAGPEEPITLKSGSNDYNLVGTLYKTLVDGKNLIANPSFEEDAANWTLADGSALGDAAAAQWEILTKSDTEERVSDQNKSLWLKGVASDKDSGIEINTVWDAKPNTRYFASVDVMATKGPKNTAYARFYSAPAEGEANNCADIDGLVTNQFVTKQYIIKTGADAARIGFRGNWFGNDTAPIFDNFQLYELANLDTDITYSVVVTTDGTDKGTELGKLEAQEGTVDTTVEIAAGTIVDKKRAADKYYSNKAASIKLEAGTTTYYVGADVAANIIGFEPVNAVTVEGYDPILPATVKPILDKDVEGLAPEALPVTWTDTKGAVADTGLTVDAAVVTYSRAFNPTAGMIVLSELVQEGVGGGSQTDAWDDAYKFPEPLNKFTIALYVIYNADGDNHILFNNASDDRTGKDAFKCSHIHIKISQDGIQVRDGKQGEEGTDKLQTVLPVTEGGAYEIIVDYDNGKYDVYACDTDTGETGIYTGAVSRTAGAVDGVAFVGNNKDYGLYGFTVLSCHVAAELTKELPASADIDVTLDYIKDGADADTLVIRFNTDAVGKTVKIYANDRHNTLVGTAVVEEGKDIILVPNNANVRYTARLVDTESGYMVGWDSDALASLVAADIADNLSEYARKGQMTRVEKAVDVLGQMGLAYEFKGDSAEYETASDEITGAWFIDARDDFIKATVDKTPAEGETPEKINVTLTMDDGLFANGLGFKVGIKAGYLNGNVGAATLPEGVEGTVFQTVTVTDDGTVTVQAADGSVYTFSLDSVEIEFVATEMADADAADADAAVDFIPEL